MLVLIIHQQIKKYCDENFRITCMSYSSRIIFLLANLNFFVVGLMFIIFKINDGKCLDKCTFEFVEIYFRLKSDTSMITGINDSVSHINGYL